MIIIKRHCIDPVRGNYQVECVQAFDTTTAVTLIAACKLVAAMRDHDRRHRIMTRYYWLEINGRMMPWEYINALNSWNKKELNFSCSSRWKFGQLLLNKLKIA